MLEFGRQLDGYNDLTKHICFLHVNLFCFFGLFGSQFGGTIRRTVIGALFFLHRPMALSHFVPFTIFYLFIILFFVLLAFIYWNAGVWIMGYMALGGTRTQVLIMMVYLHQARWTWMEPPRVIRSRKAKGRLSSTVRERGVPPRYSLASKDLVGARSKGKGSSLGRLWWIQITDLCFRYRYSGVLDILKWVLCFFFSFFSQIQLQLPPKQRHHSLNAFL